MTGVGNTVACDHPIVQADILASLRYFAEEYRVDGFRFDLATVLGRDPAIGPALDASVRGRE